MEMGRCAGVWVQRGTVTDDDESCVGVRRHRQWGNEIRLRLAADAYLLAVWKMSNMSGGFRQRSWLLVEVELLLDAQVVHDVGLAIWRVLTHVKGE